MATTVLAEAENYLYRYGTCTDTTVEPIDLIRDLVGECKKLKSELKRKKPK